MHCRRDHTGASKEIVVAFAVRPADSVRLDAHSAVEGLAKFLLALGGSDEDVGEQELDLIQIVTDDVIELMPRFPATASEIGCIHTASKSRSSVRHLSSINPT
jgi:hypothetical protein